MPKLKEEAVPKFLLPDLKGLTLAELQDLGHQMNGQKKKVLDAYKVNAKKLQDAIDKQEKAEIAERKANDPDYDAKHQGIGGRD